MHTFPALAPNEAQSSKVINKMKQMNGQCNYVPQDIPLTERVRIGFPVVASAATILVGILASLMVNHWLLVPAKQIDVDIMRDRMLLVEGKLDKVLSVVTDLAIAKRVEDRVREDKEHAALMQSAPPPIRQRQKLPNANTSVNTWKLF